MPDALASPVHALIGQPRYGGAFDSDAGRALPFVLPGELAELETPSSASETIALTGIQILRPSPARRPPGCIHFGVCGGCHYQHADYSAQVEIKREILSGILTDAGLSILPEVQTHQAAEWAYRNRIRLRVQPSKEHSDGAADPPFRVGYSRPGSNQFLPIRMCPISAPLLWRAVETLLQLATADPLCRRWLAATAEVELFCLPDESRLQAMFFLRETAPAQLDPASFAMFCERLRVDLPQLAGAGAELDPELNRSVRRTWAGTSWGAAGLAYPAAGRNYWVSRGAFFQVNRFLVDKLVALVCDGMNGKLAWDLFAGVGLFTRALAERFGSVVAVEGGEAAAADLAIAGRGGKDRPAFDSVRSSTLDFLRTRELQRERPGLIVLDPPRAGLGTEGATILTRIAAPSIVYVSCDPVTLARDLAILTRSAYKIDALHLLDLFPQTYHMETVVHLSRS